MIRGTHTYLSIRGNRAWYAVQRACCRVPFPSLHGDVIFLCFSRNMNSAKNSRINRHDGHSVAIEGNEFDMGLLCAISWSSTPTCAAGRPIFPQMIVSPYGGYDPILFACVHINKQLIFLIINLHFLRYTIFYRQ